MMEKYLLTPKEVAERLRISYGAVLLLIHTGQLPAIRVTKKLFRVPEDALREYLNRQAVDVRYEGSSQGKESDSDAEEAS